MNSINHYIRTKIKGIQQKDEDKVLIQIHLKNGELWTKEYNQNDYIGGVINDFKLENKEDIPEEYLSDWKNKNESLEMTDKIKTLLFKEIPNLFLSNINNNNPFSLDKQIIPDIIGKPFNNPFEVFEFHRNEKLLKIQKYDNDTIKAFQLEEYSPASAYCNGNNYLFISGGESQNFEILKNFWKINLETQKIEIFLMMPKKNHSMTFILGKYVFIVGGNDLKTFYFNNENNQFGGWGDLNHKRMEPALALISNNLYCFDNINYNNNNLELTFEKTDLKSQSHKWELIKPFIKIPSPNKKFNQKFFGVVNYNDNDIIFLGGNMDEEEENKYNYKYNILNKTIEFSDISYKEYNLKEKTFLHFKEDIDYILPDFNRHHPEVLFFQKNKAKLSLVKYEPEKKKLLKNTPINHYDYKHNFNMPLDLLNGVKSENIKITEEKKPEIREPSFPEINLYIKNKFEQPPFKPPEIDPNKPDLTISIPNLNDIKKVSDKHCYDISVNKIERNSNEEEKVEQIDNNTIVVNSKNNEILKNNLKPEIKEKIQKGIEEINYNNDINEQKNINQIIKKEHIKEKIKSEDFYCSGVIPGLKKSKSNINSDIKDIQNNNNQENNINKNKTEKTLLEDSKNCSYIKDISKDILLRGTIKGISSKEKRLSQTPIKENKNKIPNTEDKKASNRNDLIKNLDLTKDINLSGIILGKRQKEENSKQPSIMKTKNIVQNNNPYINHKSNISYGIGKQQEKTNLNYNYNLNNQNIKNNIKNNGKNMELSKQKTLQNAINQSQIKMKYDFILTGIIIGEKDKNNLRHNSYAKRNIPPGKSFKEQYYNYPSRNNNFKGKIVNSNYYKNYTHNPQLNSPKFTNNGQNLNNNIREQNNNINENVVINKEGKIDFTLQDAKFSSSNILNIYTNENNNILDNSRNKMTLQKSLYESNYSKEQKNNNNNLGMPKLELNNINDIKKEMENKVIKNDIIKNSNNLEMIINTESNNNTKVLYSSIGNNSTKKKGKLPMVNQKRNDFEPIRTDQVGNLDIDKINADNLKFSNANGQKN